MDFALRDMGFDAPTIAAIHDVFDFGDEPEQTRHHRAYIRDSKAMKATPADVMEYPNAYYFVVDMPGLKRDQIKVHLEDGNVLVIAGERRREEKQPQAAREKEKQQPELQESGVKFLRMERRLGKMLKKFVLPENANTEAISAALEDGVLTVSVEKRPPPEPKKPKVIEVSIGQHVGDTGGGRNGSEHGQIRDGKHK